MRVGYGSSPAKGQGPICWGGAFPGPQELKLAKMYLDLETEDDEVVRRGLAALSRERSCLPTKDELSDLP